RSEIADYQQLFGTSTLAGVVDISAIATAVKNQIQASQGPSTADELNVMSAATATLSALPIPGVSNVLTAASGVFALEADLLPATDPTPALLTEVDVTQQSLATELVHDYQSASEGLSTYADYLVQDPAKLKQAAALLWDGPFSISNTATETDVDNAAEIGT